MLLSVNKGLVCFHFIEEETLAKKCVGWCTVSRCLQQ